MGSDSISEAAFLVTELRYTLGQLHVQSMNLNDSQRSEQLAGGRSVDAVLQEMAQHEAAYQRRIEGLLQQAGTPAIDDAIPLPLSQAEGENGGEYGFEHLRAQTIERLQGVGDNWPPGLVDLVREQVQHDRQMTTEIANLRMQIINQPERPDLDQPLTTNPEPHELEHS